MRSRPSFSMILKQTVHILCVLVELSISQSSDENIDFIVIAGGLSGTGVTTRYWDCCRPYCAGANTARVDHPVVGCAADGITQIEAVALSGCSNADGTAFMCNDQQPIIINETLAIGFTAASFASGGGVDGSMCCTCILLSFQGELLGKQMIVQVTNTGGDLNYNQFDLAMPGGGVGLFNEGCMRQWDAPLNGWGEQYGGVTTEAECDDLPALLQDGCRFRFEFMAGISNPDVTFVQVECPAQLTGLTGCQFK